MHKECTMHFPQLPHHMADFETRRLDFNPALPSGRTGNNKALDADFLEAGGEAKVLSAKKPNPLK